MRVAIVTFPGSNCDYDLYKCVQLVGGAPEFRWHRDVELGEVDVVMLPGGFSYGDYLRAGAIATMSPIMDAVKDFANVLRTTPTYAIWDDHDYGPNDSDGTAEGKENSLRAFRELWALPPTGTKDTPGAFYSFQWGDVEFFMLDGRYHRSPDKAENDDKKRMLGDAQFEWLLDGLRNSTATFKVLASGSTLQASSGDGWRIYDFSRNRLYNAVNDNGIDGVIYLSGDVHSSSIQVHEAPGYPLVEVISSGIANSGTKSFATLSFDTSADDPTVRVRIIHGDGSVPKDEVFALSAMTTSQ